MTGGFRPAGNPSIVQAQTAQPGRAHVLVIGNEKGGSGKSTTALHIAVSLLNDGAQVATIDLDARQGTLSRYLENRAAHASRTGITLAMPQHAIISASIVPDRRTADADEKANFEAAIKRVSSKVDYILVDTPGSDTNLSRIAHTHADTLLTPLNDSFVDLDLLARVDPDSLKVVKPSIYAETVWRQRQLRAQQGGRPVDWIVMRNRLSSLAARNKRDMGTVLEALAKRLGFRAAEGLSERVIYRELFLNGLTLLDLKRGGWLSLTMSHVAARQEVRDLVASLNLPPPQGAASSAAPATAAPTPDRPAAE